MSRHKPDPRVPCPRCGRLLRADELTIPGLYVDSVHDDHVVAAPVYSCDRCVVRRRIFGPESELFTVALSFMIGPDGQPMDPAAPDGVLRLEDDA